MDCNTVLLVSSESDCARRAPYGPHGRASPDPAPTLPGTRAVRFVPEVFW